ncbi:unnamed protein product [Microthlaspi erraticum]|uniref:Uncharacterized protein n=1 Tax=Microthlaspi erraticum TaxID=1685480 RepID=A0A6D2L3M1_9BRAS|nr:unnamed protein product [Microthlaspi erraticum]
MFIRVCNLSKITGKTASKLLAGDFIISIKNLDHCCHVRETNHMLVVGDIVHRFGGSDHEFLQFVDGVAPRAGTNELAINLAENLEALGLGRRSVSSGCHGIGNVGGSLPFSERSETWASQPQYLKDCREGGIEERVAVINNEIKKKERAMKPEKRNRNRCMSEWERESVEK